MLSLPISSLKLGQKQNGCPHNFQARQGKSAVDNYTILWLPRSYLFPLFFALSNCVCFSVCQMDLAQTKEIWKELQSIVGDGKVRHLHDFFFITYHYI